MKRLRENAMLEAEIGVDGDVFVEGHHVGQLAGFRFTPDATAEGPDAKAVLAAAQKSLGLEFEARAACLHASGNGDFALGSDAVLRWMGDPIARLTDSDEILRPRAVLLADEQLSTQAREVVVARIDRFVNHHINTILKPLDDLMRAEDLEGLAKGLAFRVVEALGTLFRRDVADDVKALDQDARGSLRRYGIRFGAYHVFMPALLKPAPAELITLLWSLRNDGFDKIGYGEITGALAAGRTSIVTDPSFEREFYKLSGFRFLGKRAVRIDILERLADIIRPLLQWKPGLASRPDGAYDGRRFVTTPAMLSILGATPDDIEEILKGLGYRADNATAKDVEAHFSTTDAKIAAAQIAKQEEADKQAVANASADAAADNSVPVSDVVPEADAGKAEVPPAVAVEVVKIGGGKLPSGEVTNAPVEADASTGDATTVSAEASADTGQETATDAAAQPVEAETLSTGDEVKATDEAESTATDAKVQAAEEELPKPILLWHPAGRSDGNRGRGRPQHRQQQRQGAARGKGGNNSQGDGQRDGPRDGQRDGKRDGNKGKANFKGKPNKPGKGGNFSSRPPRKEKPIDPDSPFAKLAALKEQMSK